MSETVLEIAAEMLADLPEALFAAVAVAAFAGAIAFWSGWLVGGLR